MKLKAKFICLGMSLVVIVVATEWLNYKNKVISEQQKISVDLIQRHMDSDMKHDGIRGNVYSAMVALQTKDAELSKESVDEVKNMAEEFVKNTDENIASDIPDGIKQQFLKIKESVASYVGYSEKISQQKDFDAMVTMLPEFNEVFGVLEEDQEAATKMILIWSDELHASSQTIGFYLQIALVALLAIAVAVPLFAIMAIFKPLTAMISSMRKLSEGDTSFPIPYAERQDEMGEMASTVQVFKDNALHLEKISKEQEASKIETEKHKRQLMNEMADKFEASVRGIVNTVASAATELAQTAEGLVKAMGETSHTAQNAAAAATQTVANVQSVAFAAEEMTASVKEISSQLQNSNMMVQDSVKKAESADVQTGQLSSATTRVKNVIELISNIAGQINLLALNATIESARAGEAGKGFAVVASEVKNLASQTDKSVQEIEAVIQEMNLASDGIIESLKGIRESIENISGASSTIAAAVEEQSATTNEIAKNMQSAAQATESISANLSDVTQSSSYAESSSNQLLEASTELSRQAEHLNKEVEAFLGTIRAA